MKPTNQKVFLGIDEDGPIVLLAGSRRAVAGRDRLTYYQLPKGALEVAKAMKYVSYEPKGEILVDTLLDGNIKKSTKEECKELIDGWLGGAECITEVESIEELL